jgi:hypothetical protein
MEQANGKQAGFWKRLLACLLPALPGVTGQKFFHG